MSSFSELDNLETQLTTYFNAVSANLNSPGQPLPSFEDYSATLEADTLLSEAQLSAERAASYSVGALVDTVHMIAAVNREFNIRTKSKAQYFADGVDDAARTSDFIDFMHAKYSNYMRGTTPEQGKE